MGKTRDRIGVCLSEEAVKIAHLRITPSEKRAVSVAKGDIRGVPPDEVPMVIQALLSELNLKKPAAVCALPSQIVTTKNIEIPSTDPAEIKSIIDLQAGRHTPYSREEILIGYLTIGTFQRNYTKVLMVIVNRDVIQSQLGILSGAGIRVEKVVFAAEGSALFYAQQMNIKEQDAPVGIIDIAQETTDFIIECNRAVITSRSIPVGMTHLIKGGKDSQEKLIVELLKSIEVYQSEDISRLPESYFITHDDAKLQELRPVLQERMKANIKIVPYLDHIKAGQPVMLKLVSEYNDDSFLNVIAAALTADDVRIDLTPDEIKTQRAVEKKGRQLIKASILGLMTLSLVCTMFFSKIYFKSVFLEKLKKDHARKRAAVTALDKVVQKTQIVKDYLNDRMVALDVLNSLYHLVPDEIYLQSIDVDQNGSIAVQGISESMSRVFHLVSALEDSPLFKGVKTKSTSAKKERGKDVAAFELGFRLESAPDEGEDESGEKDKDAQDKDKKKDGKESGKDKKADAAKTK